MLLRFQAKVAGTDIGPRAVEAGINNGRSGTRGDGGLVATELEDHFDLLPRYTVPISSIFRPTLIVAAGILLHCQCDSCRLSATQSVAGIRSGSHTGPSGADSLRNSRVHKLRLSKKLAVLWY